MVCNHLVGAAGSPVVAGDVFAALRYRYNFSWVMHFHESVSPVCYCVDNDKSDKCLVAILFLCLLDSWAGFCVGTQDRGWQSLCVN